MLRPALRLRNICGMKMPPAQTNRRRPQDKIRADACCTSDHCRTSRRHPATTPLEVRLESFPWLSSICSGDNAGRRGKFPIGTIRKISSSCNAHRMKWLCAIGIHWRISSQPRARPHHRGSGGDKAVQASEVFDHDELTHDSMSSKTSGFPRQSHDKSRAIPNFE